MKPATSHNFSRFAMYAYAHDMKNILSGLQYSISLLQKDTLHSNQSKCLEMMQKKLNLGIHFSRSFDTYLSENYCEKAKNYIFVDAYLERSIPLIQSVCGEHNEVVSSYSAANACVECTEEDFEHIIFNILLNALKASPKGEKVYITSKSIVFKRKKWVSIEVVDKGGGIKSEIAEEVKKYFNAGKQLQGILHLGTGLKIVCSLLKKVGAYLDIKKRDNGTQIFLLFPIIAINNCKKNSRN